MNTKMFFFLQKVSRRVDSSLLMEERKDLYLILGMVCSHLEDFTVNIQHAVKGALHAVKTGHS